METEAEKAYAAFEEKVKRTVYFDNLSPEVTDMVIKSALEQYGAVTNVRFMPYYVEPYNSGKSALVEMENGSQASTIVETMSAYPFMMCGMPRPVRVCFARPGMFDDRPPKPGMTRQCYWLDPNDPDFEVAQKIKDMRKKHLEEMSFLAKKQLEEEEKLSKQQSETLRAHYQKHEMIDTLANDGTLKRLAWKYKMRLEDDRV